VCGLCECVGCVCGVSVWCMYVWYVCGVCLCGVYVCGVCDECVCVWCVSNCIWKHKKLCGLIKCWVGASQ